MTTVFAWIAVGLATTALVVASMVLNAFVVQYLWLWFVIPLFGLSALSLIQAMGFGIVVAFMTKQPEVHYENLKKDSTSNTVVTFLRPLMYLGIAWIVQLFM